METQLKQRLFAFISGGDNDPKKVGRDYAKIVLGSLVVAIAYVFFFTPHKIIPGGVYGISIILHYKSMEWFSLPEGLPIGMTSLCFNIPLIIIATRLFGKGYMMRTIVTFVCTAVFVDLLGLLQNVIGIKALVEGET